MRAPVVGEPCGDVLHRPRCPVVGGAGRCGRGPPPGAKLGLWGLTMDGRNLTGSKTAAGVSLFYPNDTWNNFLGYRRVGDGFQPALGFVPRPGVQQFNLALNYLPRPPPRGSPAGSPGPPSSSSACSLPT